MQIRNLGGSGLRVSAVGLGCNNFGQRTDLEASRKVIHKAIDLGVTLFDTADIYAGMGGSETVLGEVLGDRRKDIVLATKYSKPMSKDGTKQGASRRYIMSAVEASLTAAEDRLHRSLPAARLRPADAARGNPARARRPGPPGQGALHRQFEFSGLADRGSRIHRAADERQPLHLVPGRILLVVRDIEKDLLPAAQAYNLGLLPFFPLASGLLTGKYKRGAAAPEDTRFAKAPGLQDRYVTPRNEDIVEKLQAFAQGARPHHARACLLLAGVAAASRKRHRRRHPRRTGRAEREGDRLGTERGRDGGDR